MDIKKYVVVNFDVKTRYPGADIYREAANTEYAYFLMESFDDPMAAIGYVLALWRHAHADARYSVVDRDDAYTMAIFAANAAYDHQNRYFSVAASLSTPLFADAA